MTIDLPTLMLACGFVGFLCGSALLLVWSENRKLSALCWAASDFAIGIAVTLLAIGFVGNLPPIFIAGLTFLIAGPALTWAGIRLFNGKPLRAHIIVGGFLVWFATIGVWSLFDHDWILPVVNTLVAVSFSGATIWELRKDRDEVLQARIPLTALLALNILVFLLSIPEAMTGRLSSLEPPPLTSLFGLVHIETLIYLIGTTIFLFAMIKERSELRHLRDAETDALTGLANRRAFLETAERIAVRCSHRGEAVAVVVFDLDHFKLVNDTFGHAFGDQVLCLFAEVARETLRPGDLIGRVGGEEFFAILPGATPADGCAVADRVRKTFAEAARSIGGRDVGATVSAGVSVDDHGGVPLPTLFEAADAALYKAKLSGRNCVQSAGEIRPERTYPRLVRVA